MYSSPLPPAPATSFLKASLGLSRHTLQCEGGVDRGGIYNSGFGVSKGSKNRSWMTSATDLIAPLCTRSVAADGKGKGAKRQGRESGWASP